METSPEKPATAKPARSADEVFQADVVPFLTKHCVDCHGSEAPEGDMALDGYKNAAAVAADPKPWQRVIQMLRTSAMPPEDSVQPTEEERKKAIAAIEQTVYNFDCNSITSDPGHVTIRRLNRADYNNTVRDLLGVQFKPADDFPSDDVGGGFDNLGAVLTVPPLLIEKYLAAAERIAEEVIVGDPSQFVKSQYRDRRQLDGEGSAAYDRESRRWTIPSEGAVSAEIEASRAGEYTLRVFARATQAGDEAAQMEIRVGDQKIKVFDVNAVREQGKYEVKATLEAGKQRISAHFINDFYDPEAEDERRRDRNLIIHAFEVDGPLDVRPEDYPESHRKLVAIRPEAGRSVLDAAKANLAPLLSRAYRRKVTDDEVLALAKLVEQSVAQGDSFEQGMQVAIVGMLVSPHFLFRVETPRPADGTAVDNEGVLLRDFELASRLSYFLWSSMPDDELFALAAAGKLQDPALLEQQVRRMLTDPKSEALVHNFAAQWLNLRLLDGATPNPEIFGELFSPELKADMRRETELFIGAIIKEDRSILDFLEGRFTFVNERLAQHYGIGSIRGDEFQRITFTDDRHTGVLTQASILTLTSNPGRTSPVKRGKWIMENILGSPPPDPPPDVPDLEITRTAQPNIPLRKQLEIHRQNAVCASCHKVMDQLGFGLENFDPIGRWREKDGPFAIDSSGELPGAERFQGPLELAQVISKRRSEFARCLAEKMLTYALGRELRVPDRCTVDKIIEEVEAKDYRFSALVLAIVTSDPFRKQNGDEGQP